MKKLFLSLSLLLATLLPIGVVVPVGAVTLLPFCNTANAGKTDVCKDTKSQKSGDDPVIDLIKTAIQIFAIVLGIAAIIVIIVSGLRFINSGGDSQKAAAARSGLIYAVVGLVIAALAQTIVSFVLGNI